MNNENQAQSSLFLANMRRTLQPITNRGTLDVADTSMISEAADTLLRTKDANDPKKATELTDSRYNDFSHPQRPTLNTILSTEEPTHQTQDIHQMTRMVEPVIKVEHSRADVNVQNTIGRTIDSAETLSMLVQQGDKTPVKMKILIDSLYEKEKKFIYQKQGQTRADFVNNHSVIFNLQKIHELPINYLRNEEQA